METTDIRAKLVALLYEHQEDATVNLDSGRDECRCGEQGTQGWREHFADVLLSLEGVAIVALPEPDEGGNYWYDRNYVYADSDGLVMTKYGTTFGTADEVRRIAAAFLAAADATEAVTDA